MRPSLASRASSHAQRVASASGCRAAASRLVGGSSRSTIGNSNTRRRLHSTAASARPPPAAAAAATKEQAAFSPSERDAYERGYAAGLAAAAAPQPTPTLARSAAKGVSWRVFSAAITVSLAALIFGKAAFEEAGGLAAVSKFAVAEFAVKLSIYVAHERLWAWIDGRRGGE